MTTNLFEQSEITRLLFSIRKNYSIIAICFLATLTYALLHLFLFHKTAFTSYLELKKFPEIIISEPFLIDLQTKTSRTNLQTSTLASRLSSNLKYNLNSPSIELLVAEAKIYAKQLNDKLKPKDATIIQTMKNRNTTLFAIETVSTIDEVLIQQIHQQIQLHITSSYRNNILDYITDELTLRKKMFELLNSNAPLPVNAKINNLLHLEIIRKLENYQNEIMLNGIIKQQTSALTTNRSDIYKAYYRYFIFALFLGVILAYIKDDFNFSNMRTIKQEN